MTTSIRKTNGLSFGLAAVLTLLLLASLAFVLLYQAEGRTLFWLPITLIALAFSLLYHNLVTTRRSPALRYSAGALLITFLVMWMAARVIAFLATGQ